MARLNVVGLDQVINEITQRGEKASGIIDQMLQAGAEQLVECRKIAIEENDLIEFGLMLKNVKATRIKRTPDGGSVEVYSHGSGKDGVRNAKKEAIHHYGTSKNKATRFVDRAEKIGEEAATIVMTYIWDSLG